MKRVKKPKYKLVITVRLAQPVIAMLNRMAKAEGVTRTTIIQRALTRDIDAMLAAKTASAK